MKRLFFLLLILTLVRSDAFSQDKIKKIKFSNITEFTVGLQIGSTTRITGLPGGGENELQVAGYKVPSPRVSSSFGALFGNLLFLGPGLAYSFQPADNSGSTLNPNAAQHRISVFGHARVHLSKGRLRPYLEIKGGYIHIFSEDVATVYSDATYTWDGVFAEPAIGFAIKLGKHGQLNTSLGYQFLDAWNRSNGFTSISAFGPEIKDNYNRLLLSVGFSFY